MGLVMLSAPQMRGGGGGFPPGNVTDFTAAYGFGQITLRWRDPEDTSDPAVTWAGTKIVRQEGRYPHSETDGVLVIDSKFRDAYQTTGLVDSGLVNERMYYYMAFPYSTDGAVNRSAKNRVSATPLPGKPLSELPVGAILRGTFNNAPTDFILVQQGSPSALYDGFDGTTTLLFKDIVENRQWHSANVNDYANSTIHSYLNGDFLNLFDAGLRSAISQVKIPYRPGTSGSIVSGGENGLTAKVWLLSGYEVNWTSATNNFPADGTTLSHFAGTVTVSPKRIARFNGTATVWWLRSPLPSTAISAWHVTTNGDNGYNLCSNSYGIRPAFALPNTLCVEQTPNPDGSYNLMIK